MALFDMSIVGPPPGNATTGTEQWINLGRIPLGKKIWIGAAQYASPGKSITFELRTNVTGQEIGNLTNTKLLDAVSVSPKSGTLNRDLYKNNKLHIVTYLGTGKENWWIRLVSKSSTQSSYYYSLNYTTE